MNKSSLISKIRTAVDRCLSRLVRLRQDPRAHRDAVRLAQVMWSRSYRDVAPHWRPLADTAGVISQIDNMHAGVLEENEDMLRKWRSDQSIFRGALQLLKEAGLSPDSTELIEAAKRFDDARPNTEVRHARAKNPSAPSVEASHE